MTTLSEDAVNEYKEFDEFNIHNFRDGILFSCYLDAAALVPVPASPTPSHSDHRLENYRTDYWVQHSYNPPHGPSINYRLQHIPPSSTANPDFSFVILFEEQTYHASFNICIRQILYPELTLTWRGPILVMKVDRDHHPENCNDADILLATEAVKKFVISYTDSQPLEDH